jgi:hypothetical protein
MSIIYNDGTTLHSANLERPRTDVRTSGTLAAVNAEVALTLNGESTATVDIRGGFTATFVVEGTIDGTNYISLPFFNPLTELWATTITAAGQFTVPNIAAFRIVRVRCTAYTPAVTALVTLNASIGVSEIIAKPIPSSLTATATGLSGAGVTLTITSGGTGLYHYITYLRIDKFAVGLLVAGATPVVVTTTNIPGALAFSFPADAALQGTMYPILITPSNPLKSTTAGTNTTIVCPATTNIIWRVTAVYYVSA